VSDSLKITKNEDASFSMNWDSQDPNWSWLNGLTDEQIRIIMEEAIKDYTDV